MKKWEYLVERFVITEPHKAAVEINKLAEEGWRLIQVSSCNHYFERERIEPVKPIDD